MRISCFFACITLLNIPRVIYSAVSRQKKPAGNKPKVLAPANGGKGAKRNGGKGVDSRKKRIVTQQIKSFEDLRKDMDESAIIGKYDGLVLEMPKSTGVLRVRSVWSDLCADYYSGLQNSRAAASGNIKPALERLEYRVCEEPMAIYSYEEFYVLRDVTYRPDEVTGFQSLVCTFSPKDPENKNRIITVARYNKTKGWDFFFRKMKKRIKPGQQDSEKQLLECLSMLDQFIRLQNLLADRYGEETQEDVSKLKLHEIVGSNVEAIARKNADEENTDGASGLGAGYIVLIIFGVLVALGGGYYGFTKCSSKGKDASGDDQDRGEKRKRRSDKNRTPHDARTAVQVVGRPLPI